MHTFQNIAHLLGPKTQLINFEKGWGRGACMPLTRNNPNLFLHINSIMQIILNSRWYLKLISKYRGGGQQDGQSLPSPPPSLILKYWLNLR